MANVTSIFGLAFFFDAAALGVAPSTGCSFLHAADFSTGEAVPAREIVNVLVRFDKLTEWNDAGVAKMLDDPKWETM